MTPIEWARANRQWGNRLNLEHIKLQLKLAKTPKRKWFWLEVHGLFTK